MKNQLFRSVVSLVLCALMLLAPMAVLAERELQFLAIEGGEYSAKPKMKVPQGGFPENEWVQGTNPFTGESWEGQYLPVMVNIDTDPLARPNMGVSQADVIYELPLHRQGHTRSVAMFMGDIPSAAGPVRSARIPMLEIREEWNSGYIFFGSQEAKGTSVKEYLRKIHRELWDKNTFIYPIIDGITARYGKFFVAQRGYVSPHNQMVDVRAVHDEFAKEEPAKRPWLFTTEGLDHGASAFYMSTETRPDFIPSYRYNEETRTYDRYYNGEEFIDGADNRPTTFANVIFMRTKVTWYKNGPDKPVVELTGEGTADIFQNGRYIRGSWVRAVGNTDKIEDNLAARTIFFDDQGNELKFLVGKTFIHIVDTTAIIAVGNDPTEGDALTGVKPMATPEPTKTPKPTKTPRPTRTPKP